MSERALNATNAAEMWLKKNRPVFFYEGQFTSGIVRYWTGVYNISVDMGLGAGLVTWEGKGNLGSFAPILDDDTLASKGFRVELTGVKPSTIALALAEGQHGYYGRIYAGFMGATDTLIATPDLIAEGWLDVPSLDIGGETGVITITYEDELARLDRPKMLRWTQEDHQLEWPTDTFCNMVVAIQDRPQTWGVGL